MMSTWPWAASSAFSSPNHRPRVDASSRHHRQATPGRAGRILVCANPSSPPSEAPTPHVATMAHSEWVHQAIGTTSTMLATQMPSFRAAAAPRPLRKSSARQKSWASASTIQGANSASPRPTGPGTTRESSSISAVATTPAASTSVSAARPAASRRVALSGADETTSGSVMRARWKLSTNR
jgi:hypothetical protein